MLIKKLYVHLQYQNKTTGRFPRNKKQTDMKPRELLKLAECKIVECYRHGSSPDYTIETKTGFEFYIQTIRTKGQTVIEIQCDQMPKLPNGVKWYKEYRGQISADGKWPLHDESVILDILKMN